MSQPPEAASRAAAFGGVTTVIDFAGDLLLTPGAKPAQRSMLEWWWLTPLVLYV